MSKCGGLFVLGFILAVSLPLRAAAPPEPLWPAATESLAWTAAANSDNLARAAGVKAISTNAPTPGSAVAVLAIDGNAKTEWATADAGAILQLEFPALTRANGVSLQRDIAVENPGDAVAGGEFVIEASTDGKAWDTVAATGRYGLRVTRWAALFPERELRFLRLRMTHGGGRVGEFGVFRADLSQAKKWGWDVPAAAWRTPLDASQTGPGALGVNLAFARGNAGGVVLPRSLQVVRGGVILPTVFAAADPQLPEIGGLWWHDEAAARGTRWLYFNIGKPEDALPPPTAGKWTAVGFQWHGATLPGTTPGVPLWVAAAGGGWVIPPARDGLVLAVSTMWNNFVRSKPLAATVAVANGGTEPFAGWLRLLVTSATEASVELASIPVELEAKAKVTRIENLSLAQVASGDYLLTAQLVRDGQVLAAAQRPVYVAPVPHPGMTFGIYSLPYYDGMVSLTKGLRAAAAAGFTEITGQYWGEGYNFQADAGLRFGLLWNPTIEPIYVQNPLADSDPSAACVGPDGKRLAWHPSTCYTHPEVAKRTEALAEKWLREIVTVPGFAGYIEADDDVHLADKGCFNASCSNLFRQVTGLAIPPTSTNNVNHPQVMPAPGLIPDDQPWLVWSLFRCSHIRGNLPKIYMRAKNRVDPRIKMGAVRGHMQFPFYTPATGEYPPLFDALYDAPGSYAYLYWVRQMEDYIAHGALAAMGSRGKGRWILGDFAFWPAWILQKSGDGRWQLDLTKSLTEPQVAANLYPPGALNKQVWCMLAGGFTRLHMFQLPEPGGREDLAGTADERVLQTWGARARAYGQLLAALREPTRPVAILTSISTSAFTDGLGHSGITAQVLKDCLREHVPADMIAEEEILAGGLTGRQVLLLPDLQYLRRGVAVVIEKWAANGGTVLAETGAAVQPTGSRAVQRAALAAAAGRAIHRELECDNPLVITREFELDGVRYYYLVNLFTDRWSAGLANDPWVAGEDSMFTQLYTPRAETAHLRLPGFAGTAWDVFGNQPCPADEAGTITVTIGGDDGMLLALFPRAPGRLALKVPGKTRAGNDVVAAISLRDAAGAPMRGGVPVQISVTDPRGFTSEYSQYALATGGVAPVSFRTALNDRPGKWRVQARSLVGRAAGTAVVQVVR